MRGHVKGYFKGDIHSKIILSVKTLTNATNKVIAEQIGISERTLYNIKAGKNKNHKTKMLFLKFMKKAGTEKSIKIGILVEHYKRTGKKKPISIKQAEQIFKRRKKRIDEIAEKFTKDEKLIYKNLWY